MSVQIASIPYQPISLKYKTVSCNGISFTVHKFLTDKTMTCDIIVIRFLYYLNSEFCILNLIFDRLFSVSTPTYLSTTTNAYFCKSWRWLTHLLPFSNNLLVLWTNLWYLHTDLYSCISFFFTLNIIKRSHNCVIIGSTLILSNKCPVYQEKIKINIRKLVST